MLFHLRFHLLLLRLGGFGGGLGGVGRVWAGLGGVGRVWEGLGGFGRGVGLGSTRIFWKVEKRKFLSSRLLKRAQFFQPEIPSDSRIRKFLNVFLKHFPSNNSLKCFLKTIPLNFSLKLFLCGAFLATAAVRRPLASGEKGYDGGGWWWGREEGGMAGILRKQQDKKGRGRKRGVDKDFWPKKNLSSKNRPTLRPILFETRPTTAPNPKNTPNPPPPKHAPTSPNPQHRPNLPKPPQPPHPPRVGWENVLKKNC